MKEKRALTIMIVIFLSMIFFMVTPKPAYAESSSESAGELRIGLASLYTETFHPFWAPVVRKVYYEPLYDYLIGLNAEGKMDPKESLAYRWEEAPDHLSWIFWIRDGIKFHNGTPMTLEDVKYSLEETKSKKATANQPIRDYLDRVEIVPPNKVIIRLKKLLPTLPYHLCPSSQGAGIIFPKGYIEKFGDKHFESNPIGTGPYKFLERKENNYIKYVAQDHHWRVGRPHYKYLVFKLIPEEGTREAGLKAGEVNVIQVGITRANTLGAAGFRIHEQKGAVDLFLDFMRVYNPENPLHKREVRQALIYAIDKRTILKHVLMDRGNLIGHAYLMYSRSLSYKDYPVTPYDPERSKRLLAEAGYPKGFTIYLYSYATVVPEQKLINQAIAGYWEAIGMNVKIIECDAGSFFPIWTKHKEPLGPAVNVHSWPTRPMGNWESMFGDPKKEIFSQNSDPVLNELMKKWQTAITMDQFIQVDRACEERVLEMAYNSGIASTSIFFASTRDLPNWNLGKGIYGYRFEYIGVTK